MDQNKNSQLFMLHFAGGNAYSFQFLRHHIPGTIDFCPIELPGRGKRINEKLLATESAAIEDQVTQIISFRNAQPYLIFGHSMGASLGLKIAKKLEELKDPPRRLIVAGNAGPGTGDNIYRSEMSDSELKEELRMLGGVPDEVLNHNDLFNFFAPIMRSDFKILESSEELEPGFRIHSPIVALMGSQEEGCDKIENWKNFTSGEFRHHLLPGNHFFIHDHPKDLVHIITQESYFYYPT